LNHRSRLAGYELDDQTLSPIDSVALIAMRHPKTLQNIRVLDPSWTLKCRLHPSDDTIFDGTLGRELTKNPREPSTLQASAFNGAVSASQLATTVL
jgi:hypothetical protein